MKAVIWVSKSDYEQESKHKEAKIKFRHFIYTMLGLTFLAGFLCWIVFLLGQNISLP